MDWLKDTMWLVWVAGALVAGVLEIASLDLVLAMLAAGALAAAVPAAAGASATVQVVTFAVTSSVLLVTVRPALKRYLNRNAPFVPTNVHALTGRSAEVLTEVSARGGTVKLSGETWSARTQDPDAVLAAGSTVEVVDIDGATAVVRRAAPRDTRTSLPYIEE